MHLLQVRGQHILEINNVTLELSKEEYLDLANIPARDDEITYYQSITTQISEALETIPIEGVTTRRIVIQNSECISLIHLLLMRPTQIMNVYMRSSDAARIASDLGFLSRHAASLDIGLLRITMGSFHVILGDSNTLSEGGQLVSKFMH